MITILVNFRKDSFKLDSFRCPYCDSYHRAVRYYDYGDSLKCSFCKRVSCKERWFLWTAVHQMIS